MGDFPYAIRVFPVRRPTVRWGFFFPFSYLRSLPEQPLGIFRRQTRKKPTCVRGRWGCSKKLWRQEHQPCAIQKSNSIPRARLRLTTGHLHCNFVDLCLVYGALFAQRLLGRLFPREQPLSPGALRPPLAHLISPISQEVFGEQQCTENPRRILH